MNVDQPESVQAINAFFNGLTNLVLIALNAWQILKLNKLQRTQKIISKVRGEQIDSLVEKIKTEPKEAE